MLARCRRGWLWKKAAFGDAELAQHGRQICNCAVDVRCTALLGLHSQAYAKSLGSAQLPGNEVYHGIGNVRRADYPSLT